MEEGGRGGQRVSWCVSSFWSAVCCVSACMGVKGRMRILHTPTWVSTYLCDCGNWTSLTDLLSNTATHSFHCNWPIKNHTWRQFTCMHPLSEYSRMSRIRTIGRAAGKLCTLPNICCFVNFVILMLLFLHIYLLVFCQIAHLGSRLYLFGIAVVLTFLLRRFTSLEVQRFYPHWLRNFKFIKKRYFWTASLHPGEWLRPGRGEWGRTTH